MSISAEAVEGRKGKKGSSGSDAKNTLKSKARARLIFALSEGPIVGLVDGAKSIFREQTPLRGSDGVYNLENVDWQEHKGYPDDEHFQGFNETGTILAIDKKVTWANAQEQTIVEPDADAARAIVRINSLFRVDKDSGKMKAHSVVYSIEVRPAGGTWTEVVRNSLENEKCVSPVQIAHRFKLPLGGAPWDIQVKRLSDDETDDKKQSDIYFESLQPLVEGKFTYPFTAAVAMEFNAEDVGNSVGSMAFHVKGRIVDVPSNYDPNTRVYSGIWDGTFKQAWTNNPAWVFWDLVTNDRFGMGEFVDRSTVNKWSLYQIARYCDEMVMTGYKDSAGNEIYEPRYTFNGVISGRQEAYHVLQSITATWRGMGYWSLGQMFATADMPMDPVALVTPANVIGGEFSYSSTATKSRHSVVLVKWNDKNDFYQTAVETVIDNAAVRRFGWREKTVTLQGCTSRGLAHRHGKWILDVEQNETETVSYRASLDHINVMPGDIVAIADPRKAEVRMGGRVASQASTTITLDADFVMKSGHTYTIRWTRPDGKIGQRGITSASGRTLTLDGSVPVNERAQVNGTYVITGTDVAPRQYRVLTVGEIEPNIFQVTALFHDPNKYARVERGIKFRPIPYTAQKGAVPAPTNLVIVENGSLTGSSTKSRLTLSWTPPTNVVVRSFVVEIDSPEVGTITQPATTANFFEMDVITEGLYTFTVRTVDFIGRYSAPAKITYVVKGDSGFGNFQVLDLALKDAAGLTFIGQDARIVWKNHFPTSTAPGATGSAQSSPLYSHNIVQVHRADTGELLRTQRVTSPEYTYDYATNAADNGKLGKQPCRALRFVVTLHSVNNTSSLPAEVTVSNPAPDFCTVNAQSVGQEINVIVGAPNEPDLAGIMIWIETDPAFDPLLTEPKFIGTGNYFSWKGEPFTAYYVRAAAFDVFGKDGLNISSAFSVNTEGSFVVDVEPPDVPTNLQLTSKIVDDRCVLTATWGESVAEDLASYDLELTEGTGNPVLIRTAGAVHDVRAIAGVTYKARIRAVDRLQNSSNFTAYVEHVAARDTVAPAQVTGLAVFGGFELTWLSWDASQATDLAHYEILETEAEVTPTATTVASFTSPSVDFVRQGLPAAATRHYRVRAVDTSGNPGPWSVSVSGTTAADTAITTEELKGLIDATSFAAGIEPLKIVAGSVLPTTKTTTTIVFGGKLYRWDGTKYTATVPAGDVTGKIAGTQIADDAISTPQLAANAVTANEIAGNTITAAEIAAGAIGAAEVAAGAITTEKMLVRGRSQAVNPDPLFEDANQWKATTAGAYETVTVADAYAGSKVLRITGYRNVVPTTADQRFPIDPTKTYLLELAARKIAGTARFYGVLHFFDAAGAIIPAGTWWASKYANNHYFPVNALPGATWTHYATKIGAGQTGTGIPPNAAYVGLGGLWNYTGTATDVMEVGLFRLTQAVDGEMVVDGSIKAKHLATEELITNSAQIKDALITDAKIAELSAAKLKAGTALTSSLMVEGRAIGSIANTDVLFDSFQNDWQKHAGVGTNHYNTASANAVSGTRAFVSNADGEAWWNSPEIVAFDPGKLYRVTFRVRRSTGTTGIMYLGLQGLAADRKTLVNSSGANTTGSQHYVVASGLAQSGVGTAYQDFVGYVKGHAGTGGSSGTLANPAPMHSLVRFIRPMAIFNYTLTTGGSVMVVDSVKIEAVTEEAAAIVNAGSTQIEPGKIKISGSTTLSDWTRGGDETRIDGGMISANTIRANALEIGSRNVTLTGIEFEHNKPSTNYVSWTAGYVRYVNDAGTTTSKYVSGGSAQWTSGILFIYWPKDGSALYATTSSATAFAVNNLIVATYEGGVKLDADYGRTIIDGSKIKTGTVSANQIAASAILARHINSNTIETGHIRAGHVTTDRITMGGVTTDRLSLNAVTISFTVGSPGNYQYWVGQNHIVMFNWYYDLQSGSQGVDSYSGSTTVTAKVRMYIQNVSTGGMHYDNTISITPERYISYTTSGGRNVYGGRNARRSGTVSQTIFLPSGTFRVGHTHWTTLEGHVYRNDSAVAALKR